MRRGSNFGLLLLFYQIARVGLDNIPPATLLFLAVNVIVHLVNPLHLGLHDVCIGAFQVIYGMEVQRLLLAAFYHLDDIHLYYNMTSLIWKGRNLEPRLGTKRFSFLVLLLAVVSNILLALSNYILAHYTNQHSMHSCAAGFSAVLFGLKVVLNSMNPDVPSNVMGLFTVPSKYVYWVELLLIQILVPNASFIGHLCGIFAGLLYVQGYFNALFSILDLIPDHSPAYRQQASYTYQSYRNPYGETTSYPRNRRIVNGVLQ